MRVMLDTNVLVSLLLFPTPQMTVMMECIFSQHELLLSSFVLDEFDAVMRSKFPTRFGAVGEFLRSIKFSLIEMPATIERELFRIRDPRDYPVLYGAIIGDADVLITGDKDFALIDIDKPRILTPAGFVARMGVTLSSGQK